MNATRHTAPADAHFLFNTLATVQHLIGRDRRIADFMLTQLVRYLRLAEPGEPRARSTLGRQVDCSQAYLQIARIRMGGRLSTSFSVDEALRDCPLPPGLLMPLVDNALRHGVEPKPGPVHIAVQVQRQGRLLSLSVQDDGVGLAPAAWLDGGAGLSAVRRRLRAACGESARLSVVSRVGGGVVAQVLLDAACPGPPTSEQVH